MRIVICDDHVLFAEALAVVLRASGHEVFACVNDPSDASEAVSGSAVDLCLMDLHFPTGSGLAGVRGVLAASPLTRVVVLTGSCPPEQLAEVLASGAHGLAVKADGVHRVIEIVERVHQGRVELTVPPGHGATAQFGTGAREQGSVRFLTMREREVLRRLVVGETTADLARAMNVRSSTARTHIQNLLNKLGVHSKVEAVALAVSEGIVELPSRRVSSPPAGASRVDAVLAGA